MIASGHVQYHDALKDLMVDIDSVAQHPENYNNGDIEALAMSIEANGMYRPVYTDATTGYILGGNSTWAACKMLGAGVIPVVPLHVDGTTARRILSADNRVAALAVPDPGMLLTLLEHLQDEQGLQGSGYGSGDLEVLRSVVEIPYTPIAEDDPLSATEHTCPRCGYAWPGGNAPR